MDPQPGADPASPSADLLERRWTRWLFGLLAAAAAARFAVRIDLQANHPMWGTPALDSRVYLEWAAGIADGSWNREGPFFLNPLYAYALAPLAALFDAALPEAVRVVQALLGLATTALVALAARRWFGALAGLAAGACAGLSPILIFYETEPMIVAIAVFLNAAALWLVAGMGAKPPPGRLAALGIVMGLAVLARPNVALFLAALIAWWPLRLPAKERLSGLVRTGLLVGGCAVVPVLPAWFHNAGQGDPSAVVTTSSGINLWLCNNPRAWRTGEMGADEARFHPRLLELDAEAVAESATGDRMRPSEVSAWWASRTRRVMAENPGTAAAFVARKALFYVHPWNSPSSHHFEALKEETRLLRWIPFGLVLVSPLAIAGLVVATRRRETWPPLLLWATYGAGLAVFYPLAHYRAPALPGWFVLAGAAVGAGVAAWRSGEGRRRLRAAGVLAAALLVARGADLFAAAGVEALAPTPDRRTLYHYNTGLGFYDRAEEARAAGRTEEANRSIDRAEERFQRATEALSPDEPARDLVPIGFAMVARFRGDRQAERRWLEEAERLNPNDASRVAWLGSVLLATGDRAGALDRADRVVELPTVDVESLLAVGSLLFEVGRFDMAGEAFGRAYAQVPERDDLLANQSLCLRKAGRYPEAWRLLQQGVRRHPASGRLRIERARVMVETRSPDIGAIREEVRAAASRGAVIPPDLERFR